MSVPLMLEYEEVLLRQENRTQSGLTVAEVNDLLDAFCGVTEHVDLSPIWRPVLRDPDDEMVLATGFLGRADMLLTFNVRDFAQAQGHGIEIVTPGNAWAKTTGG